MQKVIVLVGPTSAGKTSLSIELARRVGGEIVSADSRQVYRGLDIGSGKVTPEEMKGVPHHLLDVANPRHVFTVAEYVALGREAISEIASRCKVPIIVGGTGFYIDALLGTVSIPDVPEDSTWREAAKKLSLDELNAKLEELDSEKAKSIDTKNKVRLVRAIEVARALGRVPKTEPKKLYDVLWIGVTLAKKELDEKIHARLHARMKSGMLEEAKKLFAEGLSYERMQQLGLEYRYMAWHLEDLLTQEEMLEQLESEIKKYAKRQMTWFRRNKKIYWHSPTDTEEITSLSKKFLH